MNEIWANNFGKSCEVYVRCVTRCGNSDPFYVTVLNASNKLVFSGYTNYHGVAKFTIDSADEYRIKVQAAQGLSPGSQTRWVFLCPWGNSCHFFMFDRFCIPQREICATFLLTDQNYEGLPITKGDIYLWPAHM